MTTAELQSVSPEEKHSIGVHLLGERRYAEASAMLKAAYDEAPTSSHANDWAYAEALFGHAADAERGFKQALALDADNVKAVINFGALLATQKRFQEAIPLLEMAAERVGESERAAISELLKLCRAQAMAVLVRESKAAYRDRARQLGASSLGKAGAAAKDYWFPDITGWFSRADALHVYTAIKLTRPRRILEIGTFYGRSTATICAAVKSLGNAVDFITIDLDFRTEEEARKAFAEIHGMEQVAVPEQFKEALELGFSTTEYAEYCLRKQGLAQFVTFESGDFRNLSGEFDFVFADVMHDPVEIQKNLPAILRMISPGGILAVHDLNAKNKQAIETIARSIEFISSSETLGIFRVNERPRKSADEEHPLDADADQQAGATDLPRRCPVQALEAKTLKTPARRLKILSAYDDHFSEMGEICETSIRLYAAIHNADFVVRRNLRIDRPPAWAKIRYLIEEIRKGDSEFLLWIDADACFLRGDVDILSCVRPDKELFVVNHRVNAGMLKNFPGVFAYCERPNTGVILVRTSAWSLNFLECIWQKKEYINHPWWENAAFMAAIGYWQELTQGAKPNEPDQGTLSKIGWLPLEWNSVPTEVNGEPAGITQNPIILHFAGMPNEARKREMKQLVFGPTPLGISPMHTSPTMLTRTP